MRLFPYFFPQRPQSERAPLVVPPKRPRGFPSFPSRAEPLGPAEPLGRLEAHEARAGGIADCFKHLVLVALLQSLAQEKGEARGATGWTSTYGGLG